MPHERRAQRHGRGHNRAHVWLKRAVVALLILLHIAAVVTLAWLFSL